MSDAFSAYTTDGLSNQQQPPQQTRQQQIQTAAAGANSETLNPAAKDALLVIFSRRGNYVQELLVEELVAAADALSREALSETLRLVLGSAPAVVALSSLEALGPLRPLLVPFVTPLELLSRLAPAVALTAEDEEALGVVRGVFQLVQRAQAGVSRSVYSPVGAATAGQAASGMVFSSTSEGRAAAMSSGRWGGPVDSQRAAAAAEALSDAATLAVELRPLLPELLPGIAHTGELFVRAFVRRVASRLAESLAAGNASGTVEAESERQLAMAALGFLSGQGVGRRPASAGILGTSSKFSNSANQFGYEQWQLQRPSAQLQPWRKAHGSSDLGQSAVLGAEAAAGFMRRSPGVKGPAGPGQLVTGLLAAPLLMVLTPLAVIHEMQRKQQQQE